MLLENVFKWGRLLGTQLHNHAAKQTPKKNWPVIIRLKSNNMNANVGDYRTTGQSEQRKHEGQCEHWREHNCCSPWLESVLGTGVARWRWKQDENQKCLFTMKILACHGWVVTGKHYGLEFSDWMWLEAVQVWGQEKVLWGWGLEVVSECRTCLFTCSFAEFSISECRTCLFACSFAEFFIVFCVPIVHETLFLMFRWYWWNEHGKNLVLKL